MPFASLQVPDIPTPNISGPNNYRAVKPFTDDTDALSTRFDEVLNSSHTLFQRYLWFDSEQQIPTEVGFSGRPQVGKNLAMGHTWVLAENVVNELRFGYNYTSHLFDRSLPGEDYLARNFIAESGIRNLQGGTDPRYFGRPGASIVGYGGAVSQTGVDQGATDEVFSMSNATSKVAGRHNLRFGVQAQYRELFMNTPVNPQGSFSFNGAATGAANNRANAVADFLLGYCSICRGQYGTMDSNYVSPTVALFLDDVWQVSNKLTIQAGIRWDVPLSMARAR